MVSNKISIRPDTWEASTIDNPLVSATNKVPDWYKEISQYIEINNQKGLRIKNGYANTTIKHCVPFLDAITLGYTLVLESDVLVSWEDNNPSFNWKGSQEIITEHSYEQFKGIPIPEGYIPIVLKWDNKHVINTPKGYSCLITHPINRFDLPFQVITGLVDTDVYPLPVKLPFFVKKNWSGVIEKGTPLAQIVPIKREKWSIKKELFNKEKSYKSSETLLSKAQRAYKTFWWVKKEYK
jgi:hypothetical protein